MLRRNLAEVLGETLNLVIELADADFGNIQLLDSAGHLRICVHHGFPAWWIDYWNRVSAGQGACGTSIVLGERVIVEDVEQSPIFVGTPALAIQLDAGVRAVQSTPVLNPSGQVIAMLSTHYRSRHRPDAKTQKMLDLFAELIAALIEQAQVEASQVPDNRFRTVVEDQTEIIARFLPDGTFTFVNTVFCQIFGKTPQQVIGQRWQPIPHPDDLTMIEAKLREMTPDNPVVTIENRVFVANGEIRWMQFVNRGFFDDAGILMETQSVGRDITQIKLAESSLRESDERLEMALFASGLVLWDWNIPQRKVTAGNRWFELLGYTYEELGNDEDTWMNLIDPKDLEPFKQKLLAHFQGETANFESEHRLRHKEGHWVSVEAKGKVTIRDKNNAPLRMVGTLLNITQRKRLQEEGIELLKRFELLMHESSPVKKTEEHKAVVSLTRRQRQILGMIAGGMTSVDIGKHLNLSTATIISHRRNMMAKLGLHSTAEVTRFAIDHGLLTGK